MWLRALFFSLLDKEPPMNNHETETKNYRVKVGYAVVHVRGRTVEEAIASARQKLALEMPRFYDIIRNLDLTDFDVQHAA